MPYLTCSSCGLPTYIVSEGTCPSCGTVLRRTSPPVGPRPAESAADEQVRAKLAMAMRELGADTALLTEVRDGREHIRWQAGRGPVRRAARSRSRDTICDRLLSGRIGSVVADIARRARARRASRPATCAPTSACRSPPRTRVRTCSAASRTRSGRTSATADVRVPARPRREPAPRSVRRLALLALLAFAACGGDDGGASAGGDRPRPSGVRSRRSARSRRRCSSRRRRTTTRVFVVEQGGTIRIVGSDDAVPGHHRPASARAASKACSGWRSRPTTRRAGCSTSTTRTRTGRTRSPSTGARTTTAPTRTPSAS